jgi:signal transduction histidine kinase/predicted RNA-binding Zn-ribbon protein involved in translation (DUF1610 family)
MRTDFLNALAHEISTPLTPIATHALLLKTERLGPLTTNQRTSVETLERNVQRLRLLVNDVEQLDAGGGMRLRRSAIDLAPLLERTLDRHTTKAQEGGLTVTGEWKGPLPVEGDAELLDRVLENLVENAIRFTPQGGRITVRATADESAVRVEVEDTGLGLRDQDFASLFVPFATRRDPVRPDGPSTGLGLSISQGIVLDHGGRIWAQSAGEGKGSTFAVVLPRAAAGEAAADASTADASDRRSGWRLIHFKCPECSSRDIELRLLRNRYECNVCQIDWK